MAEGAAHLTMAGAMLKGLVLDIGSLRQLTADEVAAAEGKQRKVQQAYEP